MEPSTFETAWKLLPDTMRRRSQAKAKTEAAWNREAKRLGGHEELLQRLKTYLRDDKDLPRSGGPGFHILLTTGRLDHWVPMQQTPAFIDQFPNPGARRAVQDLKGEAFCRSYLDPCEIEGTTLIARTSTAIDKLREVGPVLKQHGYTGVRPKAKNVVGNHGTNAEHTVGGKSR